MHSKHNSIVWNVQSCKLTQILVRSTGHERRLGFIRRGKSYTYCAMYCRAPRSPAVWNMIINLQSAITAAVTVIPWKPRVLLPTPQTGSGVITIPGECWFTLPLHPTSSFFILEGHTSPGSSRMTWKLENPQTSFSATFLFPAKTPAPLEMITATPRPPPCHHPWEVVKPASPSPFSLLSHTLPPPLPSQRPHQ